MFKKKKQIIVTLKNDGATLDFKNIEESEWFKSLYQMMVTSAVAIAGTTDLTLNELVASIEKDATKLLAKLIEEGATNQ